MKCHKNTTPLRCVWVSRRARSHMSAYIAMGIAGMLMIQTMINVAMTLYIGPVIGLTLPFISYGGSSTLTLFIAMGLVGVVRARAGTVSAPARHRDSIMIRFFKGKASFVWL